MTPDDSGATETPADIVEPKRFRIPPADWLWFLLIGTTVLCLVIKPLGAPSLDFFAHAAIGRWIWTNHAIPRETLFLWSAHQAWIDHSWLSQVMFYKFMRVKDDATGEALGLAWTALMGLIVYGMLFLGIKPREPRPILFAAVFIPAVYLSSLRFFPRPEMFSDLCTVLVLVRLLTWHKQSETSLRTLLIRCLPLLGIFALWANLHGGVLFGLTLVALTAVADALQDHGSPRARALAIAFVGCLLAIAINPYGFRYYTLFGQLHSLTFSYIIEWRPPLSQPQLLGKDFGFVAILLLVGLYCWLRSPDRRISHLFWMAFATAAFFNGRRNIIAVDWVCLASIAYNRAALEWAKLPTDRELLPSERGRPLHLVAGLATMCLFGNLIVTSGLVSHGWPSDLESDAFPAGVAKFMVGNHVPGPVFNTYATSPYLEWKLFGQNTFFIDTINAYPDDMMPRFLATLNGDPKWPQYLEQHGVNCVQGDAVREGMPPNQPMYQNLATNPDWAVVYAGADGFVWVRKTPDLKSLWIHPIETRSHPTHPNPF